MRLSVVIPALNEEDSIAAIIERTIEARSAIIAQSDVDDVEVTVVSDGSTDRTAELAGGYLDQINVIVLPENQGYGAAIKRGWRLSRGELLGFLDADGTCDPLFFADLCNLVTREGADIALGSRMGSNTKMPFVRRVGNALFALLLSYIASKSVKDTASGMRVVRRSSLEKIMPLPDGLHFTPAMSARAVLSHDLTIREKEMTYHEREGESKLHALKDGVRFLNSILQTALLYRPNRFFALAAMLVLLTGILMVVSPTCYYLSHRQLHEWMIYRLLLASLAAVLAALLFSASYVAERIVNVALFDAGVPESTGLIAAFFRSRALWAVALTCWVVGLSLVAESVVQRLASGATHEHWSRYIAMTTLVSISFILVVTRLIDRVLCLVRSRLAYVRSRTKDVFE